MRAPGDSPSSGAARRAESTAVLPSATEESSAAPIVRTETDPAATAKGTHPADAAAGAARGGIAVLGAKVFFIVIGLLQQTLLPRAIGLANYGAFSRVMAVANVVNNVVVSSSLQGVSRVVAGAAGHEDEAFRKALRVHVPVAFGVAALLAFGAPLVASFQHAPHIRLPLTLVAGVTLVYGLYAPLVGALNGKKRFVQQAGLDATSATLRTLSILGVGALAVNNGISGVNGAALGAVLGATCVLPLALSWAGTGKSEVSGTRSALDPRSYARALVPLAGAQLFTNLLMQIDITLLGRFLSTAAERRALSTPTSLSPSTAADEWVAVYRACQLFAFLPYQLLMSVTSVLFPMVARARAEGDAAAVRRLVQRGSRLGLLACGMMTAILAAIPGSVLVLAFGPAVGARGASTLRVLALGQGAFALFGIATTVLTSLGGERWSALVSLGAVATVAINCSLVVPEAEFGERQLHATATATALALVAALVVAGALVRRWAGAFLPPWSVVRVSLVFGSAVLVGSLLPPFGKLGTLLAASLIATAYWVGLFLLREIGSEDIKLFRSVLARKSLPAKRHDTL